MLQAQFVPTFFRCGFGNYQSWVKLYLTLSWGQTCFEFQPVSPFGQVHFSIIHFCRFRVFNKNQTYSFTSDNSENNNDK